MIKYKLLFLLLLAASVLKANVKLPVLFSNGMVLQRNHKIQIWGWAENGEKITVRFKKQVKTATTGTSGIWKVYLNAEPSGGPFQLLVSGENKIVINDVLVGDVWVCSGQSNMEFPLAIAANAKEEIAQADYPAIRYFSVPKTVDLQPHNDMEGGDWKTVNPKNVPPFSAVGYFFARDLYNKLKIPIGLISSNIGGTNIETWMSRDAFENSTAFSDMISKVPDQPVKELNKQNLDALINQVDSAQGSLPEPGEADKWKQSNYVDTGWKTMNVPGLWETKGWPKLDGLVWFKKDIVIAAADTGKSAVLNLGSIDDSDITYVNGIEVGETKGSPVAPRKYLIPAGLLTAGKNAITVRIEDTGGGGGFGGRAEQMNLTLGDTSLPLAGDWKYRIEAVYPSGVAIFPDSYPTLLFNAMISPLTHYSIKGIIWYQGESNAIRAYQYRVAFPLLINDWRKKWGQGNFPFLFVQIANFSISPKNEPGYTWAELRESQAKALALPNTGMAVTMDIGNGNNIHPANKQDVGARLAAIALNKVYKKHIPYSGPVYNSYKIEGNKVIISFKYAKSGFLIKDSLKTLNGFTIAAEDKKFFPAKAFIKGNKIIVYNDNINDPVAVRYAWEDNPEGADLYNMDGFPAPPFRTDDWDITTKNVVYQVGL